ncbi:MAG: hypothetical protein AAF802_04330 [Planctomycetota bacterium]
MARFLNATLLLLFACSLAGCYGMLHDQLSYTVGPEYFTKFKFPQFRVAHGTPPRLGAALVGWQATWWMGLAMGALLIFAGMLTRTNRQFVVVVLKSYLVALGTTLVVSLASLAMAFLLIHEAPRNPLEIQGRLIDDPVRFYRVAMMHNFSYLGGMIGTIAGLSITYRSIVAQPPLTPVASRSG